MKQISEWSDRGKIVEKMAKAGRNDRPPFCHPTLWYQGTQFFHEDHFLIEVAPTRLVTCWQAVIFMWATKHHNDGYFEIQDAMRPFARGH